MTDFEGFREGCRGEVQLGEHPYIHAVVHFQADGERLSAADAGIVSPDAIRIVPVDDYMSSTHHDVVLAFNVNAAEAQMVRADDRVPKRNTRLLDDGQLERLNSMCGSCHRAEGEPCPVLNAAVAEFEKTVPPMTHKEAYIAELNWALIELCDGDISVASFFQVHKPAPPELSEEDLEDIVAIAAEHGWNASIAPLEEDGESVLGIKIVGGQKHKQSE